MSLLSVCGECVYVCVYICVYIYISERERERIYGEYIVSTYEYVVIAR